MKNSILNFEKITIDNLIFEDFTEIFSKILPDYILNNKIYFEEYELPDDIKIETIAYNIYDDEKFWDLIMLINKINPIYDLPKSSDIIHLRAKNLLEKWKKTFGSSGINFSQEELEKKYEQVYQEFLKKEEEKNESKRTIKVPYLKYLYSIFDIISKQSEISKVENINEYKHKITSSFLSELTEETIVASNIEVKNEYIEYDLIIREDSTVQTIYDINNLNSVISEDYETLVIENFSGNTIHLTGLKYNQKSRKQFNKISLTEIGQDKNYYMLIQAENQPYIFDYTSHTNDSSDVIDSFLTMNLNNVFELVKLSNTEFKIISKSEEKEYKIKHLENLKENDQKILIKPIISLGNNINYRIEFSNYDILDYTSKSSETETEILNNLSLLLRDLGYNNQIIDSKILIEENLLIFDIQNVLNFEILEKEYQFKNIFKCDVSYDYIPKTQIIELSIKELQNNTDYQVLINGITYTYNSGNNPTEENILQSLMNIITTTSFYKNYIDEEKILKLTSTFPTKRFIVTCSNNLEIFEYFE